MKCSILSLKLGTLLAAGAGIIAKNVKVIVYKIVIVFSLPTMVVKIRRLLFKASGSIF